MRLRPKQLRVFPNPWGVHPFALLDEKHTAARAAHAKLLDRKLNAVDHSTYDHEGRPNGVVHADMSRDGGAMGGRLVGATVDNENTTVDTTRARPRFIVGNFDVPRQRTVYSFLGVSAHETTPHELAEKLAKAEPVSLPATPYYLDLLREGGLIAADEATAKAAGVHFEAAEKLFPKLSKAGAQAFDAQYSEEETSAYEHFVKQRAAAKASGDETAPPKRAAQVSAPATAPANK